jgi:hypothetical protein
MWDAARPKLRGCDISFDKIWLSFCGLSVANGLLRSLPGKPEFLLPRFNGWKSVIRTSQSIPWNKF